MAIVKRPRGGEWLFDELQLIREEGVDVLVSLLERKEEIELELTNEGRIWRETGGVFLNFPILDRSVPESSFSAHKMLKSLIAFVEQGNSIAVHCRMSIGRSSIVIAALMASLGFDVDDVFRLISHARGLSTPETSEQVCWVKSYYAAFLNKGKISLDD